ncbi:MAG TPA: hypothetical protein VFX46_09610, partial [Hyphomicrobiaceae bacterium]|nr:hypothetical protein [Hyphomicrobiaceae bacterium]
MRKPRSESHGPRFHGAVTRRGLLLGASASLLGLSASAVNAQATEARWWESIFDPQVERRRRRPPSREPSVPVEPNDLRPDATPWRSEVMLRQMDDAIARYQHIVSQGGWHQIPQGPVVRPGEDDKRVPYVRRRLIIEGDLGPTDRRQDLSYTFDARMEHGLREFQRRYGL